MNQVLEDPGVAPLGQAALGSRAQKCLLPNVNGTGSFDRAQGIDLATSREDPSQRDPGQPLLSGFLGINLDKRTLQCLVLMEEDTEFPIPGWVLRSAWFSAQ